jgi:hypothetical protein
MIKRLLNFLKRLLGIKQDISHINDLNKKTIALNKEIQSLESEKEKINENASLNDNISYFNRK